MSFDVERLFGRRATNRWERVSIGDVFERLTYSYPDKEAVVGWGNAVAYTANARLTYREADELANRIAHALLARGLQRGDRVLLFCENSVEAYVAKFGVAKAGLVSMPVNPMMAPDVVAELIGRCEPAFAIADAELWPRAEAAFAAAGLALDVTIPVGGEVIGDSTGFREFAATGAPDHEPDVEIHADDIWQILFTSGTTALPKGAMLSHQYGYMTGMSFATTMSRGLRTESDLRLCTFLPIVYHVGDSPFSLPAFFAGGTLILGRGPDPRQIAQCITREGVTALWAGAPMMLNALAAELAGDRLSYDARSLTVAAYGWAALPPGTTALLKQVCGDGFTPFEVLGQTEAVMCHKFWPDKWPETYRRTAPQQNYVGVPGPLLASKVIDPADESREADTGVPGEAVYRSPAVTAGYFRDEAATREAFRTGWFHSGDSCSVDEQGLREMVDRFKDIVKSGGENVSSLRVEAVLSLHAGVAKAAVVGLPHERWGEAVTAFVIPAGDGPFDEEAVIAHAKERLGRFEVPKRVVAVTALPETVGGKVLKYRLREEHARLYDGVAP